MTLDTMTLPVINEVAIFLEDSVRWRLYMARRIASELDAVKFGVKEVYLFGSTEEGCAGLGSDIDLIVYVTGNRQQRTLLREWFSGWDKALCALNEIVTGQKISYMPDVHYIIENDIKNRECFATKIGSVYEAVTLLPIN